MRTSSEHPLPRCEQGPPTQRIGASTTVATLLPAHAPGRLTRKAREYRSQIVQLRAQGYTLEAIQQALATVGVLVSISTVRREAIHPVSFAPWPDATQAAAPASSTVVPAPSPPAALSLCGLAPTIRGFPDASSGKDIAAAYADGKSTNALARAKERS